MFVFLWRLMWVVDLTKRVQAQRFSGDFCKAECAPTLVDELRTDFQNYTHYYVKSWKNIWFVKAKATLLMTYLVNPHWDKQNWIPQLSGIMWLCKNHLLGAAVKDARIKDMRRMIFMPEGGEMCFLRVGAEKATAFQNISQIGNVTWRYLAFLSLANNMCIILLEMCQTVFSAAHTHAYTTRLIKAVSSNWWSFQCFFKDLPVLYITFTLKCVWKILIICSFHTCAPNI